MRRIEKKILDYAIEHWHSDFTGVSGISISQRLNTPHSKVLQVFNSLEEKGYGSLRSKVKLYSLELNPDSKDFGNHCEIITSIFFPSRNVLKKYIEEEFIQKEIPEYKLRLQKGDSQIRLYYFDHEVLQKYLDHPEIYDVSNSVIGGNIHIKYDYYKMLSEEEIDQILFPTIRFGKRKLVDDSIALSVIVHDLSELPDKEQKYWNSYEIESPEFCLDDPDFEKFFRRDFGAEFIDDEDPLSFLFDEINKINELFSPNFFFSVVENPYLGYPIVNSEKSISDCCSELFKIIGPNSFNTKLLERILTEKFGLTEEDFYNRESNRKKSKFVLFALICQNLDIDQLIEVVNDIKDLRISADHRIIIPGLTAKNYISDFRRLVHKLSNNLRILRKKLVDLYKKE